jgi:hypothetical protein
MSETKKTPGTAVAPPATDTAIVTTTSPPGPLVEATAGDGALGISNRTEDQYLAQLRQLQALSPQCDPNMAEYIAGAQSGDFVITELHKLFKGAVGLGVLHCGQIRTKSEFLPERQGFVARWLTDPSDIETRIEDGKRWPVQVRKSNGNLLIETIELYLLAEGIPCVMFCSATKVRFARQWMAWLAQPQFINPRTGRPMPSYARRYRLYSASDSNARGRWAAPKFEDLGWVDPKSQEFLAARAFAKLVAGGTLRIAGDADAVGAAA